MTTSPSSLRGQTTGRNGGFIKKKKTCEGQRPFPENGYYIHGESLDNTYIRNSNSLNRKLGQEGGSAWKTEQQR